RLVLPFALAASLAHAQGFGSVRGTIKDPTGSVVPEATVTLKATGSGWTQTLQTDILGTFMINAIPIGEYMLSVEREGFKKATEVVMITIVAAPSIEVTLPLGSTASSVEVTAAVSPVEATAPTAASPPVLVSRQDIMEGLPGADRMSSLQFITETTPGAFV